MNNEIISPQAENGHTDIANELIEAMAKIRISGEAMQVLLYIIRKTYGWHKKEDKISLSQFTIATGLKRAIVCRALNKLKSMNLISLKKETGSVTTYCFNKHYNTWKPVPKKRPVSKMIIGSPKKDNKSVPKKRHTKETSTKENITKETIAQFNEFWSIYPRKVNKAQALKEFLKIDLTDINIDLLIGALKLQIGNGSIDLKDNMKYCPHASSWLHQKRYLDSIIEVEDE